MQGISAEADPIFMMQEALDAGIEDSERELRKWCLVFAFQCSPEGVYGDDVMRLAATLERFVNDGRVPSPEKLKAV